MQGAFDCGIQDAPSRAVVVKPRGQSHEPDHQGDLEDESCLEQRFAGVLTTLWIRRVGHQRSSVGRQDLDDDTHGNEGGENAARMDG